MNGYVGATRNIPSKKDALWFDSIAMLLTDKILGSYESDEASLLEYLISEGIVEPISEQEMLDSMIEDFPEKRKLGEYSKIMKATLEFIDNHRSPASLGEQDNVVSYLSWMLSRILSLFLSTSSTAVIPILPTVAGLNIKLPQTKEIEITNIIVNMFPEPVDSVSWEQIVDFRKDENARFQLLELRRWMRQSIRSDMPVYEVKDELEYLLHEYKRYYKLHKMKFRTSILSSIVKIPFAFIENTVKLKLENSIDALFILQSQKAELLEAEFSTPGKEVAYITRLENLT